MANKSIHFTSCDSFGRETWRYINLDDVQSITAKFDNGYNQIIVHIGTQWVFEEFFDSQIARDNVLHAIKKQLTSAGAD